MKLSIQKETLLKPLLHAAGVAQKTHTNLILTHILFEIKDQTLTLTSTDLEIALCYQLKLEQPAEPGAVTLPAQKLLDICRALPEKSLVAITTGDDKATIQSGRSRFVLKTLPGTQYPDIDYDSPQFSFSLKTAELKELIENTAFAMGQQDVRFYLNGLLLDVQAGQIRAVATDGHRLAQHTLSTAIVCPEPSQFIVPRKGITELFRILEDDEEDVSLCVGGRYVQVKTSRLTFTTQLIEGKFPDYQQVYARENDKVVSVDRDLLKQMLGRIAVLTTDKEKGVLLQLTPNHLEVSIQNRDSEVAEEGMEVDYSGEAFSYALNVFYLIDVLNAIPNIHVRLQFSAAEAPMVVDESGGGETLYVIMPVRI